MERLRSYSLALRAGDGAALLQRVANDLTGDAFPGIESTPSVCGSEPRVVRTRIPVWVLEHARRLGATDADLLRSYPALGAEGPGNARAYARTTRPDRASDPEERKSVAGRMARLYANENFLRRPQAIRAA